MKNRKDTPRPESNIEVRENSRPRYDFFVRTSKKFMNKMRKSIDSVYKPFYPSSPNEESYDTMDQEIIYIKHSDWKKYDESEKCINRILHLISRKQGGELILQNLISTNLERKRIIVFGKMLRGIEKYSVLSSSQIYIVLIFCYYGMNLIEQYWDWLSFKHIKIYFDKANAKIALNLIFDISAHDIINKDGTNLSEEIRRAFMGFDYNN